MVSYKQPTFQERAALAAKARQAALEKHRARPPMDEAVLAMRRDAELARDAAKAKAREDRLASRNLEKLRKQRIAEEAAAAVEKPPVRSKEEQKALRDARYAARKSRQGN